MKIGNNLKKHKESKILTQHEMTELIHVHGTRYSKIGNNQHEIPVDCIIHIFPKNWYGCR